MKILFASILISHFSFAQWNINPSINTLVCSAQSDQEKPEIICDGSGGAIVVWQDNRSSDTKIYAQRLDSSGTAVWTPNGVLICSETGSKFPKLASDGAGGAIITWFDLRYGWPNSTVSAQRVNSSGDTLWKANGVPLAMQANSWSYPVITGYGSDGAIVSWIGIDGEIFAQKIDTSGNIKWQSGGVLIDSKGSEPRITVDDAGGAIITWYDYDFTEPVNSTNVFAQRVNSDGLILWTVNDTICNAPDYQLYPNLVPDGSGGAIISWTDGRNDTNYIYAQRISASGVTAWDKNGIKISNANSYYRPDIASDKNGGAIITWLGTGYNGEVLVQHINGDGNKLWQDYIMLTFGTQPSIPEIIADGSGGAVVSWTSPNKLNLQHLNSSGNQTYPVEGSIVSEGNYGKDFQSMCTDGKGRFMFAWEDGRPVYTKDIYANCIAVPGLVSGNNDYNESGIPEQFLIAQNYPNPFNPSTRIRYSIPYTSYITLKIFNSLGEEIKTLIKETVSAGNHEIIFNADNLSSGIYFYQLISGDFADIKKMILLK